jgi:hypothetical protein
MPTEREIRASVIFDAKARGIPKVTQDFAKLRQATGAKDVERGFKLVNHQLKQVERQLRGVVKGAKEFNQTIRALDRAAKSAGDLSLNLKDAEKHLKQVEGGAQRVQRTMQRSGMGGVLRLFGAAATRPSLALAGRALVGTRTTPGLVEGPGVSVAGGGGAGGGGVGSAVAGGAAQRPGMIKRLLRSGPAMGALAAGATIYGGFRGLFGSPTESFGALMQGTAQALRVRGMMQALQARGAPLGGLTGIPNLGVVEMGGPLPSGQTLAPLGGTTTGGVTSTTTPGRAALQRVTTPTRGLAIAPFLRELEQQEEGAAVRGRLRRVGEGLGFALPQALQLGGQVMQAGGGFFGDPRVTEAQVAGLRAARAFGVDPGTTGAFLFGARSGGLVGGRGQTTEANLNEAIGDAMRLGLEGAEINTHMRQMAQDIQAFRQTGMPLNRQSLNALQAAFAASGIGGVRGATIGRSFIQFIQGIAARGGPGGAAPELDIIALQEFGDLPRGRTPSLAELQRATERLEEVKTPGALPVKALRGFVTRVLGGLGVGRGGPRERAIALQSALRQRGVRLAPSEARKFVTSLFGEEFGFPALDPEAEARARPVFQGAARAEAFDVGGGIAGRAAALTDEKLRNLAVRTNAQLEAADMMIKTWEDVQDRSLLLQQTITNFKEAIESATGMFKDLAQVGRGVTGGAPATGTEIE